MVEVNLRLWLKDAVKLGFSLRVRELVDGRV